MSRCIPLPGYIDKMITPNQSLRDELQSEKEKAEEERRLKKEQKKLKKEKKRLKKEKKEKSRADGESGSKKHRHEKENPKGDRSIMDLKSDDNPKKRKHNSEYLEKSSLTEEHGQPANVVNISDSSSDSTQNSSKRRKQDIPLACASHNQSTSTVLRIRLPLQKPKASPDQTLAASSDQLCSISAARNQKTEIALTPSSRQKVSSVVYPLAKTFPTSVRNKKLEHDTVPLIIKKQPAAPLIPQVNKMQTRVISTSHSLERLSAPVIPQAYKEQFGVASTSRRVENSFSVVVPPASKEQFGIPSASNRVECDPSPFIPQTNKEQLQVVSTSQGAEQSSPVVIPHVSKEQLGVASSSFRVEQLSSSKARIPDTRSRESFFKSVRSRDVDSQLRELIENWVPPPLEPDTSLNDDSWLFNEKPRCKEVDKTKSCDVVQQQSVNDSRFWMQPLACYLPEFGVYALPYTIPY